MVEQANRVVGYPRWCWPFCIIAIIVVIILMRWFVCPSPCPDPCPDSGTGPIADATPAHLVIEQEELVAFSQLNNYFSSQLDTTKLCWEYDNLWTGMLIHVGDYEDDCARYEGITITFTSGETRSLKTGEFDWVNIVAKRDELPASAAPMLKEEIAKLMPPRISTSACEGARIHARMQTVSDIFTVWQGADGYDFEARLDAPPMDGIPVGSKQNSYTLRLNDPFEVWIYDLDDNCVPGPPVGEEEPLHYTDVAQIVIEWLDPGTGNGVRMDPPMP